MNDMAVGNNRALNPTGDFIKIIDTIPTNSRATLPLNRVSEATQFFDSTAGTLNETDVRVDSISNRRVKNSQAMGDAFNNDNVFVTQVITTVNVAVTLQGLDFTVNPLSERFIITNTNIGQPDNEIAVEYEGDDRTFIVTGRATLDPASAVPELGIGFYLNGSPLLDTFFTLMDDNPRDVTATTLIALTAGDVLTLGVINKTNAGNVLLANPTFLISESA